MGCCGQRTHRSWVILLFCWGHRSWMVFGQRILGSILGSCVLFWYFCGRCVLPAHAPEHTVDVCCFGISSNVAALCCWYFFGILGRRVLFWYLCGSCVALLAFLHRAQQLCIAVILTGTPMLAFLRRHTQQLCIPCLPGNTCVFWYLYSVLRSCAFLAFLATRVFWYFSTAYPATTV